MGVAQGRAMDRSERQAQSKRHHAFRRPATPPVHRPCDRRQAASIAAGRTDFVTRADFHRALRQADRLLLRWRANSSSAGSKEITIMPTVIRVRLFFTTGMLPNK